MPTQRARIRGCPLDHLYPHGQHVASLCLNSFPCKMVAQPCPPRVQRSSSRVTTWPGFEKTYVLCSPGRRLSHLLRESFLSVCWQGQRLMTKTYLTFPVPALPAAKPPPVPLAACLWLARPLLRAGAESHPGLHFTSPGLLSPLRELEGEQVCRLGSGQVSRPPGRRRGPRCAPVA